MASGGDLQASTNSEESRGFRRRQSWAASSGRKHGGDEYQFGDVSRGVLRRLSTQPLTSSLVSDDAPNASVVAPHQRPSVSPKKLAQLSELDAFFKVAKNEINNNLAKMTEKDVLQVYALYKQSTVGACTTDMPIGQRKAKWQAWSRLGTMDKASARNAYCSLADRVIPGWRSTAEALIKAAGASEIRSDGAEDLEDTIVRVDGVRVEVIEFGDSRAEARTFRHAATTDVGDRTVSRDSRDSKDSRVSKDSQGFRHRDSWGASSGRKHGGDAYRPGDGIRSVFRKYGSQDVSASMISEDPLDTKERKKPDSAAARDPSPQISGVDIVEGAQSDITVILPEENMDSTASKATRHSIQSNEALDARFIAAGKAVMKVSGMSNADSLAVYAYFKQATVGPQISKRPDKHDIPACARWATWAGLSCMDSQAAKLAYCELVHRLVPPLQPTSSGYEQVPEVVMDLDTMFDAAAEALKKLDSMSTTDQLLVYSHFKQAKVGMVTGNRPGLRDPKGRAKWDAWAALKAMDSQTAKTEYCEMADRLFPGWRPSKAPATPALVERRETRFDDFVVSSTPRQDGGVDLARTLHVAAEHTRPTLAVLESGTTVTTDAVEVVSQSIYPGRGLARRCAVLASVLLAFRAAFRQRIVSRAAAWSLLAMCLARPKTSRSVSELLASIGIKIEVDSSALQAFVKDKMASLAPSKAVRSESKKAPKTDKLVKIAESDRSTVVDSSKSEMEGWSELGPSSSESRSK